ncbi:uncharacterized protein [Primulina eburnea]|uniref:uncharacterized protein n=1 Tax=Primulina eburnea TaxID=1245227 RepID=UPI003C6C6E69
MGRLFWVEFAEAHEIDYYMCKGCRAHIALEESHDSNYSPEPDLIGGLFSKVVNVQMDRPIHNRQVGNHIVSDIHCVKCCDNLGYQYVTPDQETKVQKDMLQLIMKKLLLKKGDDILDAETMIPIREENADNVEESVLPIATDNTGPSTSADRAPDADYIPSALVQHMFQTVIWGQERMERSINRLQERFDFEFPTPPPS